MIAGSSQPTHRPEVPFSPGNSTGLEVLGSQTGRSQPVQGPSVEALVGPNAGEGMASAECCGLPCCNGPCCEFSCC